MFDYVFDFLIGTTVLGGLAVWMRWKMKKRAAVRVGENPNAK